MKDSSEPGQHLEGEVAEPILLNTWKHHAGALRNHIRHFSQMGEPGMGRLAHQILVLGTEVMDLYTGEMTAVRIGEEVLRQLQNTSRFEFHDYRHWLQEGGGYGLLVLPDSSRWICRMGPEQGRYVHLHPGRWSPHTRRVRANVLKTAVLCNAQALISKEDPLNLVLINKVREQFLDLSPLPSLDPKQGLQPIIEILKG